MNRAWITSGRDAGRGGDVVQNLPERNRRAIDELEILGGAGFELGPDFAVVLVEDLQAAPHVRPVEHAGVGDQHHLHVVQAVPPLHVGTGGDDLVEVAIGRRLAVAGEGDVVQPAQLRRRVAKLLGARKSRRMPRARASLPARAARPSVSTNVRLALRRAIDLAIDAIEVADLVGIEVHADRNPARAAAEHRIDEAVVLERAFVRCVERDAEGAANATLHAIIARSQARRSCVNSSIVTVVSSPSSRQDNDVAVDLVVVVAAEVQAVAAALRANDRAGRRARPALVADLDRVDDLDPVAGLQLV